jgi:PEP-CTERM motif
VHLDICQKAGVLMPSFHFELTRHAKTTWAVVALAATAVAPAHAAAVSGQGTLNLIWLADVGAFKDSWVAGSETVNGTWYDAKLWADELVVGAYSDWRLPTMVDVGGNGCTTWSTAGAPGTDCGYNVDTNLSELAHMFYNTLGNKGLYAPGTGLGNQPGYGLSNTGPFSNLQPGDYWSGVVYSPDVTVAWYFGTSDGIQTALPKFKIMNAWAVRSGDVIAVPEPATYALSLLGLAAVLLARKRHA